MAGARGVRQHGRTSSVHLPGNPLHTRFSPSGLGLPPISLCEKLRDRARRRVPAGEAPAPGPRSRAGTAQADPTRQAEDDVLGSQANYRQVGFGHGNSRPSTSAAAPAADDYAAPTAANFGQGGRHGSQRPSTGTVGSIAEEYSVTSAALPLPIDAASRRSSYESEARESGHQQLSTTGPLKAPAQRQLSTTAMLLQRSAAQGQGQAAPHAQLPVASLQRSGAAKEGHSAPMLPGSIFPQSQMKEGHHAAQRGQDSQDQQHQRPIPTRRPMTKESHSGSAFTQMPGALRRRPMTKEGLAASQPALSQPGKLSSMSWVNDAFAPGPKDERPTTKEAGERGPRNAMVNNSQSGTLLVHLGRHRSERTMPAAGAEKREERTAAGGDGDRPSTSLQETARRSPPQQGLMLPLGGQARSQATRAGTAISEQDKAPPAWAIKTNPTTTSQSRSSSYRDQFPLAKEEQEEVVPTCPIDRDTEVPEDLFNSLLKRGKEVRSLGQHVLVNSRRKDGTAKLVRHDFVKRRQ